MSLALSWLAQPVALPETEGDEEELRSGWLWSAGTGDEELTPAERACLAHLPCQHNININYSHNMLQQLKRNKGTVDYLFILKLINLTSVAADSVCGVVETTRGGLLAQYQQHYEGSWPHFIFLNPLQ